LTDSPSVSSDDEPLPRPEPPPPDPASKLKKSRKVQPDEPEGDSAVKELINDVFKGKAVKYAKPKDDDYWIEQAKVFLQKLDNTVEQDTKAFQAGMPPFTRLRFMKDLQRAITNADLLRRLMEANFLGHCEAFIGPYPATDPAQGITFPTPGLLNDMLILLEKIPVTADDLERSKEIISRLCELPLPNGGEAAMRRDRLLDKWKRLVVINEEESESDEAQGKTRRVTWTEDALREIESGAKVESTKTVDREEWLLNQKTSMYRKARGGAVPQNYKLPARFVVSASGSKKKRTPRNPDAGRPQQPNVLRLLRGEK
jgi:hypothetical protein